MSFATGTPRDIWRTGEYFAGALAISFTALSAVAWLMLRGLKILSRRKLPSSVRHGIANLYRPGAHAQSVLVALGVGVMFTLTVYLVQHGMIAEMNRTSPPGMPNVFLIDIAPKDRDAVLDLVKQQRGVEGTPELIGTVAAKLVNIDGQDVATMDLKGFGRRYRSPRSVTSAGAMPDYVNLERGAWWTSPTGSPQVCVDEDAARILHIQPGSELRWTISGREAANARGLHPEHRFHPSFQPRRIHLQQPARWTVSRSFTTAACALSRPPFPRFRRRSTSASQPLPWSTWPTCSRSSKAWWIASRRWSASFRCSPFWRAR